MAGLFGFFNYDKEGPGVPKDAPKKKTFIVFFEIFFRNFWKFITINWVYCGVSFPLVTNGLARVGITHVARNTARDKHSFGLSDFWETIAKNWKQALPAGIINFFVFAILSFDVWFFSEQENFWVCVIGTGIAMAILVTFTMMNFYLWTLIITFSFTLKQAYNICFKLVFLNFKLSFLCLFINVVLLVGSIALLFVTGSAWLYVLLIELLLFLCVYPAFNALLIQFCTFPAIKKFIIDPYYKAHPGEDIEKRKSLGLEIEEEKTSAQDEDSESEEDEEDDGVIFND